MSEKYDPMTHECVMVEGAADYPRPILLYVTCTSGDRVWVGGSYSDEIPNAVQVGDGLTTGFDVDGDCVLSVPAVQCKFYTEAEAVEIINVIDADEKLLSYAR